MGLKGNILVTGGAGFIGSHAVVELTEAGYTPIIIDNYSNSDKAVLPNINEIAQREIKVYEFDCTNEEQLSKVFSENKIDGVIHFAAFKAVGESVAEPLKYYQNNIGSLMTLLKVMKTYAVNKLVFSSSCTVYGEPETLPVTENESIKMAESPYGYTKQVCEQIITDFHKSENEFGAVLLRYFNPIGAHPSGLIGELPLGVPNNLVPFVTQTAIGIREQLTVFGGDYPTEDGTCIRDYIHVVDLAKAHVKALAWLENNMGKCDAFNVGTGNGNSVLEVVKGFERVNNVKVNYRIGPKREGDVTQIYAAAEKTNTNLGWKSQFTLEDALKDAWRWELNLAEKRKVLVK